MDSSPRISFGGGGRSSDVLPAQAPSRPADATSPAPVIDSMSDTQTTQAPMPESNHPDPNLALSDSSVKDTMQSMALPSESGTTEALPAAPSPDQPQQPQPRVLSEQLTKVSKQPPIADSSPRELPLASTIAQALVGSSLLHFDIEEFVGGGGMGAVFRGRDIELDRTVAVKVLSRENVDDDTVRRFHNEAQSAARLGHANIPDVYFVGSDKGWHFIVFEFVEGQNIRDLVGDLGPLPIDDILCYAAQVTEAIQHASSRDVVHRDIKPSNVLITPDSRAKLVDMGLARFDQTQSSADELTATGVTLGTFDYISPEQARDPRVADVRSDIYSLGCTVYYMLTGQPPFPEGTVLQKLLSHTTDAPPDPRQFRSDIPEALTRILAKMLAKHPDERFQTPEQLLGEILLLARHRGVSLPGQLASTVVVEREVVRSPSWRNHLVWLVPVLLLMATAVALDIRSGWQGNGGELPPMIFFENREDAPSLVAGALRSDTSESSGDAVSSEVQPESAADSLETPSAEYPANGTTRSSTAAEPPRGGALGQGPNISSPRQGPEDLPDEDLENGFPTSPYPIGSYSPTQIVVGSSNEELGMDGATIFTDSLPHAVRLLKSYATIETIEIRQSDVIELDRIELDNRLLTIRAAGGHRPRIVFRPDVGQLAGADSLIEMVGGELHLDGLDLALEIPEVYVERWSLFRLKKVRRLLLKDSTVTVQNAIGRRASFVEEVAVFELRMDPGSLTPSHSGEDAATVTEIELQNCVVRGEATLLKVEDSLPARLGWMNGLLVTTERMVSIAGNGQSDEDRRFVRLDLRNVTAVMDNGMCLVTSEKDALRQPTLDIRCAHSILVTDPKWPLIAQRGAGEIGELRDQVVYYGDRNLLEGTEVFWVIQGEGGQPRQQFDFDQWQEYWQNQWRGLGGEPDTKGMAAWQQLPNPNQPVHTHVTRDYQLTASASGRNGNGSTPEKIDAGARFDQLPQLWQSPATVEENEIDEDAD